MAAVLAVDALTDTVGSALLEATVMFIGITESNLRGINSARKLDIVYY